LYGRVRVGGTLGYVAMGALVGALVQRTSLQFSFWTGVALLLVLLVSAQRLSFGAAPPGAAAGPRGAARSGAARSGAARSGAARSGAARSGAARSGSVRTLLADRRWWPFLVLVFAGGLSLTLTTTYILAYMQELGADAAGMGLALTMGAVMEVPMMLIGHRLLARYPAYSLFMLAIALTGLRLLLYTLAHSPTTVIWLQLANGLTYPLAWLSGVTYAHDHAPPGLSATAQGLFGAVFSGFGAAVGNFAGGPLFGRFGGHVTYLIFGSTILAIAAGMWLLQRLTASRNPATLPTPAHDS
jgi:PPP family 3-phenylpropionic acid transporter